MNDMDKKRERLKTVLSEAHRIEREEHPQPSLVWRKRVMAGVHAANERGAEIDPWAMLEKMVWRFAPAAGAVVLLLALLSGQVGSDPAAEVAATLSNASSGSGLYALYQSEAQE